MTITLTKQNGEQLFLDSDSIIGATNNEDGSTTVTLVYTVKETPLEILNMKQAQ